MLEKSKSKFTVLASSSTIVLQYEVVQLQEQWFAVEKTNKWTCCCYYVLLLVATVVVVMLWLTKMIQRMIWLLAIACQVMIIQYNIVQYHFWRISPVFARRNLSKKTCTWRLLNRSQVSKSCHHIHSLYRFVGIFVLYPTMLSNLHGTDQKRSYSQMFWKNPKKIGWVSGSEGSYTPSFTVV